MSDQKTTIEIEIDGQTLTANPSEMVMQVADRAGIYIPRFCYHKHLSIAANCRMCLVEVEKAPKTLPACATPVMPGMKVFTQSQKTKDAQRAVMAFLLINHPLDCPVCDQGGECELQDLSMGYGASTSDYDECKRALANENLGPLIATEMTRCIYCTRCVRFGSEIAGVRELGATFRGEHTEIGTYVQQAMTSEVSGNIIDLCPVGALTSKPYRFTARAWELQQTPSISPHDCLGSNVYVHTLYGKVMRVVSRENMTINQTWISDRDRFAYTALDHADRLKEPKIRVNGEWKTTSWEKALAFAATGLREIIAHEGAEKLAALASPSSTLEEFYLLQKIIRALGSSNIDHRLRQIDTRDQENAGLFPQLNITFDELEQCDAIVLVGGNVQKEQPLAALRVRQAALKGAEIIAINAVDYDFNFNISHKKIVAPHKILAHLKSDDVRNLLKNKKNIFILMGFAAMSSPNASEIHAEIAKIAAETKAKFGVMTEGANASGAWIAGAIPHRTAAGSTINQPGMNAYEALKEARSAYILLNVEPEFDCANASLATKAIEKAALVVALSMYKNASIEAHADVILPIVPFTETSGTYVNVTGEWQSFAGVATPFAQARPAWKVLRALGNFLELDHFSYESSEEVKQELENLLIKNQAKIAQLGQNAALWANDQTVATPALSRLGEVPLYQIDSIVRRAEPLQEAQTLMMGDVNVAKMHPETAAKYHLQDSDKVTVKQAGADVTLPLVLDKRMALETVWVPGGVPSTAVLGDLIGEMEVGKC